MDRYNRKRTADTQEAAWVADEDRFVLQQAKRKAAIRVKEGRAKPIDWLAVTLRFTDSTKTIFDDEIEDSELNIVDPIGVFEGLSQDQLVDLEKDINMYTTLETDKANLDFWQTMAIICADRRKALAPKSRAQDAVASEVDRLFATKTLSELEVLDKSIRAKLSSDEPIDVEYWQSLLQSLTSWKAKAKCQSVSQKIVENQLKGLRQQQANEAQNVTDMVSDYFRSKTNSSLKSLDSRSSNQQSSKSLDPEPLLKARQEDKGLPIQDETAFANEVITSRKKIIKLGFVPMRQARETGDVQIPKSSQVRGTNDESSKAAQALYDREVARGVGEDEEIFAGEEQVSTLNQVQWTGKHRPRKPRYFNRVQMGYEWNKYNQTHYDHDNPPPKVVQGYKFNIFYPELIDRSKAPTYRIEREGGRKRGETMARPGEEDTCLIRFISGPPYEDIAFRVVDKEWDYSAKRERGFKSSFDKGILQLHFQFKKVFYRK